MLDTRTEKWVEGVWEDTHGPKVIHIHSVGEDFTQLVSVKAIDKYWNRALMMQGVVVVHTSPENERLVDLIYSYQKCGFGPDAVIFVPRVCGSLYFDIICDRPARARIRELIGKGYKLDLFCSSKRAHAFVTAMMLDPTDPRTRLQWDEHTVNPSRRLYLQFADKIQMREYLRKLGLGEMCPEYEVARSDTELREHFARFAKNGAHGVAIKLSDRASGEGLMFFYKDGSPDEFIRRFCAAGFPAEGVLVEAAWEHIPCSLVFNIGDDEPEFLYFSIQGLGTKRFGAVVTMDDLVRHNISHRANGVASRGQDLGPIRAAVMETAAEQMMPAMRAVGNSGYRGRICVDMALAIDPDSSDVEPKVVGIFRLEKNPRTSHSMYGYEIVRSLEERWGGQWCVLVSNFSTTRGIQNMDALAEVIGRDLLARGGDTAPTGLQFYHTELLFEGAGKGGMIVIERDFERARAMLEKAELRLVPDSGV